MKQRMFGSRTVPKVAKYAVVIYMYTDRSENEYFTEYSQAKTRRTAKKMTQKLIDRLKKQPQYDFETGNIKQSRHLEYLLEKTREMRYFHVWMLQLNQYVHEIIHEYAQDYDPNNNDSKKCDFFNEIFEEITDDKST